MGLNEIVFYRWNRIMPVGYIGQESFCSSTELIGDPKDWGNSVSMLDMGCGTGAFTLHICEKFPNVQAVGIDNDENAIASATEAAVKREMATRVNFELRDMDEFVIDRSYDAIVSIDALQHSKKPMRALSTLLDFWSGCGPFRASAWCFSETEAGRVLARRWGCSDAPPKNAYKQGQLSKIWPLVIADITPEFETRAKHSLESLLEVETPFRRLFGDRVFEDRLSLEEDTFAATKAGIINQILITCRR